MSVSTLPPMRVPTLTEVVEWSALTVTEPSPGPLAPEGAGLPVLSDTVLLENWQQSEAEAEDRTHEGPVVEAQAEPVSAAFDEALLTQRILADLQRQVDLMLEYRLQTALAPTLERLMHAFVHEARDELALALRDIVAEAVAQESMRHRAARDPIEPD